MHCCCLFFFKCAVYTNSCTLFQGNFLIFFSSNALCTLTLFQENVFSLFFQMHRVPCLTNIVPRKFLSFFFSNTLRTVTHSNTVLRKLLQLAWTYNSCRFVLGKEKRCVSLWRKQNSLSAIYSHYCIHSFTCVKQNKSETEWGPCRISAQGS